MFKTRASNQRAEILWGLILLQQQFGKSFSWSIWMCMGIYLAGNLQVFRLYLELIETKKKESKLRKKLNQRCAKLATYIHDFFFLPSFTACMHGREIGSGNTCSKR